MIREAQISDPAPETHEGPARRARRDAPYPRQSLNRSIRRPGGTTRGSGFPSASASARIEAGGYQVGSVSLVTTLVVPRGVWQGSRLLSGGRFALLGTTVSPGFEFSDYEAGQGDVLVDSYPQFSDLIQALIA